jgi:thioester reductase-like protein
VLLTGATGFFGSHVLRELLRRPVATVRCLVRADDAAAARTRVLQALASATAGDAAGHDLRLEIVCGDAARPDLGLSRATRARLAANVTAVVHAAAAVDFLRPYAALRPANVDGTLAVLTFCAEAGVPLHHVSSIGVFADARTAGLAAIDESTALEAFDRPEGGYAQSKWVAERLVQRAMARGLPGVIHRPGRLVADRLADRAGASDFVTALLLLCRELRAMPTLAGAFDLTPVAYAARALVHLLHEPTALGQTFHLVHPEPPSARDLAVIAGELGLHLGELPWHSFRKRALRLLQQHPAHPARVRAPFLTATAAPQLREPRFGAERTRAALGATAPRCPPIDRAWLSRWLGATPD